jgi:diguanylate cyclase (GGDEF)-like protein
MISEDKYYVSSDEMLEKIFYYMQKLFEEKELSKILLLLTDLGRTLVNSDRASFWFWDRRNHNIWTLAALDTDKITIPEDTGLVGYSIMNNTILVINDPYNDPRFNQDVDKSTGYVTKSILTMPVTNTNGEVIGAYQAVNKLGNNGNFDRVTDIKRLSLAAAFCGKSLESYMLYNASLEDQLTGLKNRRGFYNHFEKHIKPTMADSPASLIICDIDFFKKVNDTYGHNAGDAILKHVSSLLVKHSRIDDGVFRWGGEEFIILLPKTSVDKAAEVAERLRSEVQGSSCSFEGLDLRVTMSFGVTQLNSKISIEDNISKADERLYTAKETGRNKVISN